MNQTSAWAYEDIKKSGSLSKRLAMYLFVFANEGIALTAREATQKVKEQFGFNFPVSSYTARCSDLEAMGFLDPVGTEKCAVSGKTVTRWRWNGRRQGKIEGFKICPCDKCKGTGYIRKKIWIEPDGQKELFETPKFKRAERGIYD